MKERSLVIFEQGIKSSYTLLNYKDQLKRFLKFSKLTNCDSLINLPQDKLQTLIEDYVIYLKQIVNPNSIPNLMTGIRHFFIMNRISLQWEIIRKLYPQREKSSGANPWTTEQINQMLKSTTSKRNRAFILFLASTGARIGVIEYDLTLKHLHDMDNGCKAVLLYPNETDEYWAFLTPEASQSLEEYFDERKNNGEIFTKDTPIFTTNYSKNNAQQLWKRAGATATIYRIIQRGGIARKRINRHFDIQMDHGFRKRFNTILKLQNNVNYNIAEKLMGHKNGLDGVYLSPTREQCFAEFKKAIPALMIDSSKRDKLIIEQLEKEKLENEKRIPELVDDAVDKIKKRLVEEGWMMPR